MDEFAIISVSSAAGTLGNVCTYTVRRFHQLLSNCIPSERLPVFDYQPHSIGNILS
jgi:hypothetical protein